MGSDKLMEWAAGTGRIDVLAKDRNGHHDVIELKAGACPPGALGAELLNAFKRLIEKPMGMLD